MKAEHASQKSSTVLKYKFPLEVIHLDGVKREHAAMHLLQQIFCTRSRFELQKRMCGFLGELGGESSSVSELLGLSRRSRGEAA